MAEHPEHCTYSCNRHRVVAAWLTSERPGSFITSVKNIYYFGKTFNAALTVDDF